MDKKNNIYNYKAPKSMNEEVHFFVTKGRITITTFLLRFLFSILLTGIFLLIYNLYALPKYYDKLVLNDIGEFVIRDATFKTTFFAFEKFSIYILPTMMFVFIIIQGIKRIHDTNKSGWFICVPLYNIVLLLSKGTDKNNDYGINPRQQKSVKYFDELEKNKQ
ncbi:MAG: hypothetical protein CSA15_04990 [Candidatus Delongbacteria bacterium]|nr:MAG: hypothetical protein CSA15_04990 [Candidatus Delongbacteria bacterium]